MATLAKDLSRGCVGALVIRIIAIVIGLPLGCIYIFGPIWFLYNNDFPIWGLVVTAALWLGPMLIGGVVIPTGIVLRRNARLDALFAPLGLTGKAYQTRFRQYHGMVRGRQVDVYFYRGPVLEIEVSTSVQTRMGVTDRKSDTQFFGHLMGQQPLESYNPTLENLTVYAKDETWALSLLDIPDVSKTLTQLTSLGSSIFTRQQMVLRPGTLRLMLSGNRRLFRLDLSPQQVRDWLDDLLQFAETAEGQTAPQVTDELNAAEHGMLKLRQKNPLLELWVGLGIVLFFLIAAVVITAAVFIFASQTGGL
jgi:hypothetical protein